MKKICLLLSIIIGLSACSPSSTPTADNTQEDLIQEQPSAEDSDRIKDAGKDSLVQEDDTEISTTQKAENKSANNNIVPNQQKNHPLEEEKVIEPTSTEDPSSEQPTPKPKTGNTVVKNDNKETSPKTGGTKPNPLKLSHDAWDQLMNKYVSATGKVNYAGLKREKGKVDAYLTQLGIHPPKSSWSRNEEMAYWINMYNAFTIALILNEYPVNSIMELRDGKVWMTDQMLVAGKAYTLEQIEKEMLLKKFKDPRIHFAVNCAATSCPPLHNAAWTKDNIQQLLDAKAKSFINNSQYNSISKRKIQVSKIFEWYAQDFGGSSNLINYLNQYSNINIKSNAKISFQEYDWNLNK